MKKIYYFCILVFGLTFVTVSCGPTAKELEEQRIVDSIRVADSMAMIQAEQRIADSIAFVAKEDSLKKLK